MSTEIIAATDVFRVWFYVRLFLKLTKSETACTAAQKCQF